MIDFDGCIQPQPFKPAIQPETGLADPASSGHFDRIRIQFRPKNYSLSNIWTLKPIIFYASGGGEGDQGDPDKFF